MTRFHSHFNIGSIVAACVLFGTALSAVAETAETSTGFKPTHVRTHISWMAPLSDDNWDGGPGFHAQLVFPGAGLKPGYYYGISLGVTEWDANDDTQTITGGNANSGSLSGDARIAQIAASILREHNFLGHDLMFEVGLMYQSVSSDTDITFNYDNATQTSDLELDDAFALLLGLDLNFNLSESAAAYLGLGYQLDLNKGDASAFGDDNSNVTNATIVRSGVQFAF